MFHTMITWRLWNMLRNPPFSHPLFRRTLIRRVGHQPSEIQPYRIITPRFIIELVGVLFICTAMLSPIFLILAAIGLLMILNGTIYSLVWSVRTSGLIAQEREKQTYDVCCVSPEGALGVNWAICTGYLHRDNRLEQIHTVVRSLLGMALIMVVLIALVLASNVGQERTNQFAQEETLRYSIMLVHVTTAICLIYIDHVHSIVLGCLIGLLIPSYAQRRLDAQLGTLAVYLALQISTYVAAWVTGWMILPAIYDESANGFAQISLALSQIAVFFGIREAVIMFLWHKLAQRLNLTPTEKAMMAQPVFKLGFKAR
jgi:hypothetical protein